MQILDRHVRQRLAGAASRAQFLRFATRIDGLCRRLNHGLAAVAVVLGLVLTATIALRGAAAIAEIMVRDAEAGAPLLSPTYW